MKYLVFTLAIIFGVPIGAMLIKNSHKFARWIFALMLIAPVLGVRIKFLADDFYRGDGRGFEIHLANILSWMLLFGLIISSRYKRFEFFPKNSLVYGVFVFICSFSFFYAERPLYVGFVFVQFILSYIIFIVSYNLLRHNKKDIEMAIFVIALALVYQVFHVIHTKYFLGVYRVVGTFDHPNTLSMYVELLVPIVLSAVLFKKVKWAWVYWLAIFGGLFLTISTMSRGGIVVLGMGIFMVSIGSLIQRPTARKAILLSAMLIVGFAGAIKASDSIISRFQDAPESSGEVRKEFNRAALAMAKDHPLGVGINHYTNALIEDRYAKFFRSKWDRFGVCHNIYLLFVAEIGYIGLASFIMFLLGFMWIAFKLAIPSRPLNFYNAIGLGIFAGYAGMNLHGVLEWIWRQIPLMYIFFTVSGILVAAEYLNRKEKFKQKQKRKLHKTK